MKSNITIDKPNPIDASELSEVMRASKKHWGYPDEWLKLWENDLTINPEIIRSRDFYVGRINEEIVFFYSIRQLSENRFELEDCWVAPQHIGQGYGRILFEHLISRLRSLECSKLLIEAGPHAEGFYRKMGAIRIGEKPSKIEGRMMPMLEYYIKKFPVLH